MSLTAIPVHHWRKVEHMRRIRNCCAAGFANFNERITVSQQQKWWNANKDHLRAWLYAVDLVSPYQECLIGFGLLTTHDDGRTFTTVGVLPEHARHNYGKQITADLINKHPGRVYGAARRDNPAAVRLHVAEDWIECAGPDPRLIYFRTLKGDPWPGDEAVEQWAEAGWVTA